MTRSLFIFLGTFVAGALIALVARAAMYGPSGDHTDRRGPAATVANPAARVTDAASPTADKTPVNAVCAICGMKVDPSLPTAEYQGKTIGFGCKMCAPKFKADPDRYGPLYLKGEVLKN